MPWPFDNKPATAQPTYRATMLPYVEYGNESAGIGWPQMLVDAGNALMRVGRENPRPEDAVLAGLAMSGSGLGSLAGRSARAVSTPRPELRAAIRANGEVFPGNTHLDAYIGAEAALGRERLERLLANNDYLDGFVTPDGRFLNRNEAMAHAGVDRGKSYGAREGDAEFGLSTEDLFSNPKQAVPVGMAAGDQQEQQPNIIELLMRKHGFLPEMAAADMQYQPQMQFPPVPPVGGAAASPELSPWDYLNQLNFDDAHKPYVPMPPPTDRQKRRIDPRA